MSLATRTAVLKAIRYKSEHMPSELFYVFIIAYLLYARTLEDILEYALPLFLVLVICYLIAGLLFKLFWDRQIPDRWDIIYWIPGTAIFSAAYVLIMYGFVALAKDIWRGIWTLWAVLDPNKQDHFTVVVGLMVVGGGGLLYWFRLKQRFLYGLTEAVAGVLVGMHRVSLEQWSGVPKSSGFYLALLTAGIYLVVRGIDNMHQAHRAGDPTLQRIARLIFTAPPPNKKVVRHRIPKVRPISIRKAGNRAVVGERPQQSRVTIGTIGDRPRFPPS
jgi:hypothetical protein